MTKILLPGCTNKLKNLLRKKNALYKRLKQRMLNPNLLDKLDALQAKLQSSINFLQFEYYRKFQRNYVIHPLVLNAVGLC